jgi:hypothetical protein
VRQLAERPDRERFNLPHELTDLEIVTVGQVYLPVYLVDALLQDGGRRFLAFSQIAGERDHLVERLVTRSPLISRALEAEDQRTRPSCGAPG